MGTDSSAVESLLQLSNQLNGLLDDSADLERSVTNGSAGYGITINGNILLVLVLATRRLEFDDKFCPLLLSYKDIDCKHD